MMSDRLRRGSFIRRADNNVWQVKLLKDGVLHLERAETGETDRLSVQQYEDGCFEGIIEPVRDPEAVVPEKRQALLKVPFRELPPKMVATALHRISTSRRSRIPVPSAPSTSLARISGTC